MKILPNGVGLGRELMTIYKELKKLIFEGRSLPPGQGLGRPAAPSCLNRLENMQRIGFSPKSIFDCGASVGEWSWQVSRLFNGTQIVAIEPNPKITPKTRERLSTITPAPIIEECAIGPEEGTAFLNIWDNEETKMSGSSIKSHVQGEPKQKISVVVSTLDSLCAKHELIPDLVKLDLQGFEIDALRGATNILKTTEVFVIEFGCLQAYIERTTPKQLMELMYANDYCLYDIVDLIYRPYDNALTGGDFFFVKLNSKLKEHKGYT